MIRHQRCLTFLLTCCIASIASHRASAGIAIEELFVADRATNRILSFDPHTGDFIRVLVDTGLNIPTSLAFGPGGYLYAGNLGSGEVLRVDPVTGATSFFAIVGGPGGLAYDPAGDTLFVSEFGNFDGDEVYQFDASGNLLNVIGTGSSASGRSGVAFHNNELFVSKFGEGPFFTGSVISYDAANSFAANGTIASDPGLSGANGLAFDSAGDLYVAGLLSQGIMKFSPAGGPDTSGEAFGFPLAYPSGVHIADEAGSDVLYATSLGNDNPADPIYGGLLFPGAVYKFDVATGSLIGGAPLITSGGESDHNNDGFVDGGDLAEWRSEFGPAGAADADNDGDADGADFLAWQRNLGRLGDFQPTAAVLYGATIVADAAAVPEPSAIAIALAAVLGCAASGVRRLR